MDQINLSDLTRSQRDISALLAFECMVKHNSPSKSFEGIQTAIHACNILEVGQDVIQEIYSGKIKGLPNLYKATLQPFEANYIFRLRLNLSAWMSCDNFPIGAKYVLMDLDGERAEFTLAWRDGKRWKTQTGDSPTRHSQWQYLEGVP